MKPDILKRQDLTLAEGLAAQHQAPFIFIFFFLLEVSEMQWLFFFFFFLFCSDLATVRGREENSHILCLCCRLPRLGQGNGCQPFQLDGTGLQTSFPPSGQMVQPLSCKWETVIMSFTSLKNKGTLNCFSKAKLLQIIQCNWFDVCN